MASNDGTVDSSRAGRAARAYRATWKAIVTCTVVLGLTVALMAYGPLPAALVFLSSACMGGIWVYVFTLDDDWNTRRVVEFGLLAGAATGAVAGLSTIIHGWVMAVAAVLIAGSPRVLTWLRITDFGPASSSREPSPPDPSAPTDVRVPPSELTDAELCRAWRETGKALSRRHSTRVTMELVDYRVRCLDEIEHRNPEASIDWLVDGPPLGVDAKSYLPPGIHGRAS